MEEMKLKHGQLLYRPMPREERSMGNLKELESTRGPITYHKRCE